MADAVTTTIVGPPASPQQTRMIVRMTNLSDGTGETGVLKWNPANYISYTPPGNTQVAAGGFNIESIRWAIQGFKYVELFADTTAATVLMLLQGNGFDDFGTTPMDEALPEFRRPNGIPGGATGTAGAGGGTGGIKLTTNGAASGATYDITMKLYLIETPVL